MKGAEAEMKRKEVKGNARKGRHAKEAKFTSRKLTGIQGKGTTRTRRARCPVAGCVASACKFPGNPTRPAGNRHVAKYAAFALHVPARGVELKSELASQNVHVCWLGTLTPKFQDGFATGGYATLTARAVPS